MSDWLHWREDERPVLAEPRFCPRCGSALTIVGPISTRDFDPETGARIIEWRVRCPNWSRWWGSHDDRLVLPRRGPIAPAFNRVGLTPVVAEIDPRHYGL